MKNWFKSLNKTAKILLVLVPLLIGGGFLLLGVLFDYIVLYILAVIFLAAFFFFLAMNGTVESEQKREKQEAKRQKTLEQLPENVPMKTAAQMYEYTVSHGYGSGILGWEKKHFEVLENSLTPDEAALICFVALRESDSASGFYAFAITNKRLLYAQKQTISGESVKSVNLDNLNDIFYQTKLYHGYLEFDTLKECVTVCFPDKEDARRLYAVINDYFSEFKKKEKSSDSVVTPFSAADELRKFKQLLDDGIITQEEYDAKKKQLLK